MMALNFASGLSWRGNELIHEKHVGECLTQWSTNGLRAGSFLSSLLPLAVSSQFLCRRLSLFQSVFALSWPSPLSLYIVPEGNLGEFMSHTVWVSHPYTYDLQVDFPQAKWSLYRTVCLLPIAYLAFGVEFKPKHPGPWPRSSSSALLPELCTQYHSAACNSFWTPCSFASKSSHKQLPLFKMTTF